MSERYVVTKDALDAYELAASKREEARKARWEAEDALKKARDRHAEAMAGEATERDVYLAARERLRAEKIAAPPIWQSIMGSDGHCVRSGSVVVERKTGGNVLISLAHVGGIKFRDGIVHIERADLDDLITALQSVAKSRPT